MVKLRTIYGKEISVNARGATLLEKYRSGERLTRGEAILAKCAECCNWYIDGRFDCKIPLCPLYPYSPYQGRESKANTYD